MIRQEIFSEDNPDEPTSYNNLASVYNSLEKYNQAKELHKKHLWFAKRFFVKSMPM